MKLLILLVLLQFGLCRVPYDERTFHSKAVDDYIDNLKPRFKDATLANLFESCYPNTLDTTIWKYDMKDGDEDTFVVTGDIAAMWLRDSTNQVRHMIFLLGLFKALFSHFVGCRLLLI